MRFVYELLTVNKPMFDRIIFPRAVVDAAIDHAVAHPPLSGGYHPGVILEVCRYEVFNERSYEQDYVNGGDDHMSRLAMTGRLLDVIGWVNQLWIGDDNILRASGEIVAKVNWPQPYADHKPVPYMEVKAEWVGDKRVVKKVTFTEVVLVYQAVTNLALRKFSERKSLLAVDNSA